MEAVLYFAAAQVALWLPPRLLLGRLVRAAIADGPSRETEASLPRAMLRVTSAVARRWPGGALCLQRSLVLLWLLRRRGVSSKLRIGVKKSPEALLAHAWVEVAGQPIGDSSGSPFHIEQFAPLEVSGESLRALRFMELTP
jgi:hypothetical protein